jgi:hypothetical protein
MSIDPDAFERSRAAVAVSCLEWLRCTGPGTTSGSPRRPDRAIEPPRDEPTLVRVIEIPTPAPPTHPLWDRWLDG